MLTRLLRQLAGRSGTRSREAAPGAEAAPAARRRELLLAEALRIHRSGDYTALVEHCRTWLDGDPDDVDGLQFLAAARLGRGELAAGIEHLRRALGVDPARADVRLGLLRLLMKSGALDDALSCYQQAPADAKPVRLELAALLARMGRYDDGERLLAASSPHDAQSPAEAQQLARVLFEQGRVDESIERLRELVSRPAASPAMHSDLLRALNYSDRLAAEAIYREHANWDDRHARGLQWACGPHPNTTDPERRLRIGFVSPYFRKHAVTFFFESVLPGLCAENCDVVLYADVAQQDEYSARLRAAGAGWRDTLQLDDERLARLVRADRIDILIDLSGHTPGNRLLAFARRPAPVQMTWNGYPNTTGMRAIDYRITDAACDPPGTTEHLHRERLLRLPRIFMSWRPPLDAPDVCAPATERNGHVTFGSFNACYKLSPTILQVWAAILAAQPTARLLLAAIPDGVAQRRIAGAFAASGIDPQRLEFRARVDHESFLRMHADVDVALDPFPYHGTTTTCFSLWMGVPVVSLAGATAVARVGVALLANIGLEALVARDGADYARIAASLASDRDRLAALRAGLRARVRSSPLTDGDGCAAALAGALRSAWRAWCGRGDT